MKKALFFLFIYLECAVLISNSIVGWGENYYGALCIGKDISYEVPVLVKNISNAIDISVGHDFSLALKNDGSIWAWGLNELGQLGIGLNGSGFDDSPKNLPQKVYNYYLGDDIKKIITESSTSFAIKKDGTLWWWGNIFDEECYTSIVPYPIKIDVIDNVEDFYNTKTNQLVVKKKDGTIWAWGWECYQSYPLACECYPYPVRIEDLDNAKNITRAPRFLHILLALKEDGSVWEWMISGHRRKVEIEGVKDVSGSQSHALALKEDGTVWAWGENYFGQLGNGTNKESYKPIQIPNLNDVVSVVASSLHSLFLKRDGSVWASGLNRDGQLGDGTNIDKNISVQVLNLKDIVKVSSFYGHNLALDKNGFLWAWGANWFGQIGNGYDTFVENPVKIQNLSNIANISTRGGHTLAIDKNGKLFGCGNTEYGQLGIGIYPDEVDKTNINIPIEIPLSKKIVSVSAGSYHSMALDEEGFVWAWGDNRWGQVGIGSKEELVRYPTKVPLLKNIIQISASESNSYALENDGTVWAWGYNGLGALGDGTNKDSNVPVKVKNLENVIEISAGGGFCLALKQDGTVWAWGWNYYGQLGIGNRINKKKPVQVSNLKDIVKVSAGTFHSLAIDKYGNLWGWGSNQDGELGLEEKKDYDIPVQIEWQKNIKDFIASYKTSIILTNDGNVYKLNDRSEIIKNKNVLNIWGAGSYFAEYDSEHDIPF